MNSFVFRAALLSLATFVATATHAGEAPASPPAPRPFTAINLGSPRAIAVDRDGTLYVIDVEASNLHRITRAGVATVVSTAPIKTPFAVALDRAGVIHVSDTDDSAVYRLRGAEPALSLVKAGATAGLGSATSLVLDSKGAIYVTDNANNAIRRIAPDGALATFAGTLQASGSVDGQGAAARFSAPRGIAIDPKDNLYVADEANNNIRRITPDGTVTTLAGPGAQFGAPRGLAADAGGNVYVADTDNHTIRKITSAGVVTTLAGRASESGLTDGVGAAARFTEPRAIAVDAAGVLYVADSGNGAIRQITPDGTVTTIAAATKP